MTDQPRDILLLGATGSIGKSTLEVVRSAPDRFRVVAVSAHRRGGALAELARELGAEAVQLTDPEAAEGFAGEHEDLAERLVEPGIAGQIALFERFPQAIVVNGLVGAAGLEPTHAALQRGLDVALANKEALVVGGSLVLDAARRGGGTLWPWTASMRPSPSVCGAIPTARCAGSG